MTTHALDMYVDGRGRLRGRCSAIIDPDDASNGDAVVDCMTCLVLRARHDARNQAVVRVVSINPDGSVVLETP